jgi:hypothetical protein
MHVLFYIIFAFFVVIALIYLADSMTTAAAMVGCFAYILLIANHMITLHNHVDSNASGAPSASGAGGGADSTADADGADHGPTQAAPGSILDDNEEPMGGKKLIADSADSPQRDEFMRTPEWNEYDSFKTTYTDTYENPGPRVAYDNSEKTYNVDLANTMMSSKRFRTKRAMDGATIKNANYYKYHFGNELSTYENKPWWGRAEW